MPNRKEIRLSKYYQSVKIGNDYAIFNSLLLDILYVSESELRDIESFMVPVSMMDYLSKKGIYVFDDLSDDRAIETIRNRYISTVGEVRMLYLILTDDCNLKCDYCLVNNNPDNIHAHRIMTEDIAITAIGKYVRYLETHNIDIGEIVFFGGEPLLCYLLIKKCIEYAESFPIDFKFSVITNGTLLNEEIISYFAEHNVVVGLSVDGPKKINDLHRVFAGDKQKSVYNQVMSNIDLLRRFNCKYGFSLTLTDEVLNHSSDVVEWLISQKVNVFFNLFHFCANDDWNKKSEDASFFLTSTYDVLLSNGIVSERVERQVKGFLSDEFVFSDCGAKGCRQITVKTNGDICICHADASTNKGVLGNVFFDSIESISNIMLNNFYMSAGIPIFEESCLSCPAIRICGGGCVQIAQEISHKDKLIDDSFCRYVLKVLEWLLIKYKNTVKEVS